MLDQQKKHSFQLEYDILDNLKYYYLLKYSTLRQQIPTLYGKTLKNFVTNSSIKCLILNISQKTRIFY